MTIGTETDFQPVISHDEQSQRFVAMSPNQVEMGVLRYDRDTVTMTIVSTVVHPEYSGRGIAALLARAAFEYARTQHWQVVPVCSYIDTFLDRNPQYGDLIVD